MDLNRTPVEIGYNGPIRVLYLTINELPFMQRVSAVRFPRGAEGNFISYNRNICTILSDVFISIKLHKIRAN